MNDCNIATIVSTRFGVGVVDNSWFEHRFELFEAITVSSLRHQTYKNFIWNIFVGDRSPQWVIDKLVAITEAIGQEVLIHFEAQNVKKLRAVASSLKKEYTLLALIDDDDAWGCSLLEESVIYAENLLKQDIKRAAFTFEKGYEWLISDLVDIDALINKNIKLICKEAVYEYTRPFLTMSCFILTAQAEIPDRFGSLHSTKGESISGEGYKIDIIKNNDPLWLYVRHRQADSAIRKAHDSHQEDISINEIERVFGINAELVRNYQMECERHQYSRKRTHKEKDKSQLLINVKADQTFEIEKKKKSYAESLENEVTFEIDGTIVGAERFVLKYNQIRVVVYDNQSKKFIYIKVFNHDEAVNISLKDLVKIEDAKLKYQIQDSVGKWIDITKYAPILDKRSI